MHIHIHTHICIHIHMHTHIHIPIYVHKIYTSIYLTFLQVMILNECSYSNDHDIKAVFKLLINIISSFEFITEYICMVYKL